MGIFRSELMVHKQIRIPKDIAFDVMDKLGKMEDAVEFIDLTKDDLEAKKNFGGMIKRCDEMEKKILNFEKICENYNEKFVKYTSYVNFISDLENDERNRDKRFGSTYFDLIENEVLEDEKKITDLIESYAQISENLENLIEKKSVYDKACQLLLSGMDLGQSQKMQFGHDEERQGSQSDLNFIAGVIKAEDDLRMKRMIFRISKGRAIPTFFDLVTESKINKTKIQKKIFTVFFQGGIENILLGKLLKVCDIFGASRFNIPRREEMHSQINSLQCDIAEKKQFLKQAETSIKDYYRDKIGVVMGSQSIAAKYELYRLYFKKEKLIFSNLNKCIIRGNFIDGEVWIPEEKFRTVVESLQTRDSNVNKNSELSAFFVDPVSTDLTPPTYIKTNDLTSTFQLIVDTYGVPRYREVNPALFAIVTFPFLFGVMFGDIGHGFLVALFGYYLVSQNDEIKKGTNILLKTALKARYLVLFMGIAACYCGWMYNDFLSVPLGIFGTCYKNSAHAGNLHTPKAEKIPGCTYPFGLDPKWYVSHNELAFMNSLKMKLSVILGVVQMIFGIFLKGMNAWYFRSVIEFIFEVIPQLVFMSILFGYMIVMIFIKWNTDWSADTSKAPSIIAQLMGIVLNGGSVGPQDNKTPLWGLDDYRKQENFHHLILIVCGICIPLMLFPKPIIAYFSQKSHSPHQNNKKDNYNKFIDEDGNQIERDDIHDDNHRGAGLKVAHHAEHSFGELFIHQAIETIEFVLGGVSNTASYLRLWALSLAHGQLSKVFFTKSLLGAIQEGQIIMIVVGFFQLANATFAVLLCMDLMECFLHTLRLHWVEFQNKFYKADGYKFTPFCFKSISETDE
jgi:V-type H+-transporting ATPase subunit a